MPSSATITAFNTFVSGQLIRASEHNTNWSVVRGHFLPIHPDTATAATSGAYDLGASDHRWGTLYVTTINSTNPVGGGGGGGSLRWVEGGNAPVMTFENEVEVYEFTPALSQEIFTTIRVPSTYSAGNQIKLRVLWTCASTSGDALINAVSTLIRAEVDQITSTTNQRTTTNSAVTLSATNTLEPQQIVLDLTDASGQINSVAVSAGDLIKVKVAESASTVADNIKLIFDASEVTFS